MSPRRKARKFHQISDFSRRRIIIRLEKVVLPIGKLSVKSMSQQCFEHSEHGLKKARIKEEDVLDREDRRQNAKIGA